MTTLAEKWIAEGRAEGEAKARAENRARGKAEGKAEALCKVLALKFGALTETTEQRIASASEAEFDRFVERVLFVDTLDAVLGI